MKETPWSRIRGQKQRGQRILGDCWQWEANGQCSKGDNSSFRHDVNKRAKMTQPNPSPKSFMPQNERNASRTRSPRGKGPSGRMSRWPCKDYLKGTCTNFFLWEVAPSRMLVLQDQEWLQIWRKCSYAHRQVEEQPSKRSKKNDDKSAAAMLKKNDWHENVRQPVVNRDTCHELKRGPTGRRSSSAGQLGCVFQDMTPPKSLLRNSSDMQKPIQRVKFTKAIARHADIRDQNPSLGLICPGEAHQRSPNAPKFEDRSQEETEWQEQGAREAAWKLAKSVWKLKETQGNILLTVRK